MNELAAGCTYIDAVGARFALCISRACSSVSSENSKLLFWKEVECRVRTRRGCLGGGGSSTGSPSVGETDRERDERVKVVVSEAVDRARALVLSSYSSSASRLGEIIRERISHNGNFLVVGSSVCDVR